MPQAPDAQPLKILVVTEDRTLQRQLSQFFDMLGYVSAQAADARAALAAVEAKNPHIVLLGANLAAENNWELCGQLAAVSSPTPLFKFLMLDKPDEAQLHEALEAGIDDFLLSPVGYGELLSRLRAAARVLEYDRRVGEQDCLDATTGLMSRSALMRQVRARVAQTSGAATKMACVVFDVDFFGRFRRAQGAAAAETLLQEVARHLNKARGESEILGSLGGDRFCAVLSGASEESAADWAEDTRQMLSALELKFADNTSSATASFGVAGYETGESVEQLIERAVQALKIAKGSGRDCVVRAGECAAAPKDLAAPGKLFERTVARDVMTPCTVFLQPSEPVGHAIELLERTHLDGVPVVDADGTLLGLCEHESVIAVAESDYRTLLVRDVMTTEVQTFEEHDNLSALLDFLAHDSRSLVIVVNESRPVGFVTSNSLLAMSERMTTGSFAGGSHYCDTSDYLLVPDLCPMECNHTD